MKIPIVGKIFSVTFSCFLTINEVDISKKGKNMDDIREMVDATGKTIKEVLNNERNKVFRT